MRLWSRPVVVALRLRLLTVRSSRWVTATSIFSPCSVMFPTLEPLSWAFSCLRYLFLTVPSKTAWSQGRLDGGQVQEGWVRLLHAGRRHLPGSKIQQQYGDSSTLSVYFELNISCHFLTRRCCRNITIVGSCSSGLELDRTTLCCLYKPWRI